MKPKFLCTQCQTELKWGDKFCGGCGQTIEWPIVGTAPSGKAPASGSVPCPICGTSNDSSNEECASCGAALKPDKRQERPAGKREERTVKKGKVAPVAGSWKIVAGFFAFLAVGVFLLETFTGPTRGPAKVAPQAEPAQQPAANMQALSQIEEMEKQAKANPADLNLTLQLANILNDNRFYDKSIQYYKVYLAKRPHDPNARVDMGICYKELGNLGEARKQMEQALKDEPKHLFAHFNLGIVNLIEGNMTAANEWFRKTVALAPESEVGKRAQQLLAQHNQRDLQTN
ncbi:MAG: tetratricopeptide repeat protein [Bacteroidota bacterium]